MAEQGDPGRVEEVKVLLVEHSSADAQAVWIALSETRRPNDPRQDLFAVTRVDRLGPALELLARGSFDVVLIDLHLAESQGLEALAAVRAAAAHVPLVVLTELDDDAQALAAIQRGAQDYVAKERLDGRLLRRTVRHAIERKRSEVELMRHAREVEAAHAQIEQQAAELRTRAEQLDRINRELADFAYIVSHDLKEPLRGITAYCEILRDDYQDKLDDAGRRRLKSLVGLCSRLEALIGDLLTYCRLGGTSAAKTGIDLNAVVAEVLETLRPTIDRRSASVHVAHHLPAVTGDATLIGMALRNLIANGIKFNQHPHPRVEIGCLPTDPPTLYVRDDGIGIEQKHHEAIFTIFRRLHGRKEYEGTGAGLTIVRKIVEAHGGRIWLESEPGAGATFYLTLSPAGEEPTGRPAPRPPHFVGHPQAKRRRSRQRSLSK